MGCQANQLFLSTPRQKINIDDRRAAPFVKDSLPSHGPQWPKGGSVGPKSRGPARTARFIQHGSRRAVSTVTRHQSDRWSVCKTQRIPRHHSQGRIVGNAT